MKIVAALGAAVAFLTLVAAQEPCSQYLIDTATTSDRAKECFATSGFSIEKVLAGNEPPVGFCDPASCKMLLLDLLPQTPSSCLVNGILVEKTVLDKLIDQCVATATSTGAPATTTAIPSTTTVAPATTTMTPTVTATSSGDESGSGSGIVIGAIAGVVVVVVVFVLLVLRHRRKSATTTNESGLGGKGEEFADLETAYAAIEPSPSHDHTMSAPALPPPSSKTVNTKSTASSSVPSSTGSSTQSATRSALETTVLQLWHDPAIQHARIPFDELHVGDVLNQGAFGEVYRGVYDAEPVAIKRLLPARRQDLKEIAAFLEEAKLMTTLRHDRIVRLIGVAWNSPVDADAASPKDALQQLSIVTELLEGGDLRSLLSHSHETGAPTGFYASNVKIAVDIAAALTYLHSLSPPVVHRDLKSKNVLLTRDLDAKLTDFGVSRERAEATMTAGVGSYLWMAPEIVFSRRYDEKADVFSFGVVLSELDTHELPYAHAVEVGSGHKLTEMSIVQKVSDGSLSVAFSKDADAEMVELARACVSHDAAKRPSMAEVLSRLERIADRLARASEETAVQRQESFTWTSRGY